MSRISPPLAGAAACRVAYLGTAGKAFTFAVLPLLVLGIGWCVMKLLMADVLGDVMPGARRHGAVFRIQLVLACIGAAVIPILIWGGIRTIVRIELDDRALSIYWPFRSRPQTIALKDVVEVRVRRMAIGSTNGGSGLVSWVDRFEIRLANRRLLTVSRWAHVNAKAFAQAVAAAAGRKMTWDPRYGGCEEDTL